MWLWLNLEAGGLGEPSSNIRGLEKQPDMTILSSKQLPFVTVMCEYHILINLIFFIKIVILEGRAFYLEKKLFGEKILFSIVFNYQMGFCLKS